MLLVACDDLGIQPARQIDLTGEWDWIDGTTEFPHSCGSPATIRYLSDGKYFYFGELGTWRLEGDALTEVATDITTNNDTEHAPIGRPFVSTLRWIDENRFSKRYANGNFIEFRRCP
jgi:hypothetical protein